MTGTSLPRFSRRSVLRKATMTAGAFAVGTAAGSGSVAAQKRGGRAQFDGDDLRRNEPFTVTPNGTDMRPASCMSANSATQVYLTYQINYCGSDDETDATMYVIPDEAELAPNEVYEIHAARPCRANDLTRVAFGPSNESC